MEKVLLRLIENGLNVNSENNIFGNMEIKYLGL